MSSAPSHATSCCFSSAIYGCVFLLYYCCCFLFVSQFFCQSHAIPSVPLLRQAAISARRSSQFFFLFLNLRFSLLLFVFLSFLTSPPPLLLSSLLWQLWPHPPSLCPPNPLLPPPPLLSPAPGCQTLPSRPRGKAKAVDFSPHQAF